MNLILGGHVTHASMRTNAQFPGLKSSGDTQCDDVEAMDMLEPIESSTYDNVRGICGKGEGLPHCPTGERRKYTHTL